MRSDFKTTVTRKQIIGARLNLPCGSLATRRRWSCRLRSPGPYERPNGYAGLSSGESGFDSRESRLYGRSEVSEFLG